MTLHPPLTGPAERGEGAPSPVDRVLGGLHARITAEPIEGRVADYIPELALASPGDLGIALATVQGDVHEIGDARTPFTIQSISKVVVFGMALEAHGPVAVAKLVGVEPSGEAFNSIRLHPDRGTPLNPMVNAGAIATTALVGGATPGDRIDRIVATFERYTGRRVEIDERVYRSERETGHRNRAIAHLLRNVSVISDDPDGVLDVYFRQCSILVTCRDLAMMGATLANRGVNPLTGVRALDEAHVSSVLSVMATCGMYDFAGQWLHDIGLPAKSGVAGGIMAVLPAQLGIGTYAPPLDSFGNSVRGIRVCRALSEEFDLHLLDPPRPGAAVQGADASVRAASRRRRSGAAASALDAAADRILLHRPRGDVTFATATATARTLLATRPASRFVILDVSAASRLDAAAATIAAALGDSLAARGERLLMCGADIHPRVGAELRRRADAGMPAGLDLWHDAEEALEWCEDALLAEFGPEDGVAAVPIAAGELCRRMAPGEVRDLELALERVAFAAGDVMIEEGAPSDHMLVIASGRASAITERPDGSRLRVLAIGPGMFIGEMGLIDGGIRSASVVADTPVLAHRLTRVGFEGLSDAPPLRTRTILLLNIAEVLSGHLRRATALLAAGRA
ncbi:MAG: glutaminase A [Actinobacteria bacterium]|nr:glutaminase A [Actinomycetota bacterium]